jgi:hypothetical protein
LFDDLGFMGDTECAKMILEGTYNYPPDTDKWTNFFAGSPYYILAIVRN